MASQLSLQETLLPKTKIPSKKPTQNNSNRTKQKKSVYEDNITKINVLEIYTF